MLLAVLVACVDPVAYGAVADDQHDDAPAIQQAIDAALAKHADVCIGPGVWLLERASASVGSLTVKGGPISISGAGPRTVLRMSGDGRKKDWRGLEIASAHEVVLANLTIDGLAAFDTEEQTHLVELGADTEHVVLHDVTLGPMRRPDQRVGDGIGGDCLRMIGSADRPVSDVVVTDSRFVDCDRSGIAVQRALRRVVVTRSSFDGIGDTPIDFEPTGAGSIEDIVLTDLTIHRPPDAQGAYAITLGGSGSDVARNVLVSSSRLDGGGIFMMNVQATTIVDNTISHGPKSAPTLSIMRRAVDVRIARNHISRPAGSDAGPLIRAAHNNGYAPDHITITDNVLVQETAAPVVSAISTSELSVTHNEIEYSAAKNDGAIVSATAVLGDIGGITVEDNVVRGKAATLVLVNTRDHKITRLTVHNNRAHDVGDDMKCLGAHCSDLGTTP